MPALSVVSDAYSCTPVRLCHVRDSDQLTIGMSRSMITPGEPTLGELYQHTCKTVEALHALLALLSLSKTAITLSSATRTGYAPCIIV